MKDVVKFVNEVRLELSRVVWPKWDEFIGSTIVVIVLVTIMSLYLFVVDKSCDVMVRYILKFFSA